jgi:hypothetical protein
MKIDHKWLWIIGGLWLVSRSKRAPAASAAPPKQLAPNTSSTTVTTTFRKGVAGVR